VGQIPRHGVIAVGALDHQPTTKPNRQSRDLRDGGRGAEPSLPVGGARGRQWMSGWRSRVEGVDRSRGVVVADAGGRTRGKGSPMGTDSHE